MIGKLSSEILSTVLETLPIEFSVVDSEDKVLAWNKHKTRIFKRSEGVLGKDVHNCHPKKSIDKVHKILAEMKEGKRDKARFWIDLPIGSDQKKQKVLIEYYALRSDNGKYIGCLEASQNITDYQNIIGEKRLID